MLVDATHFNWDAACQLYWFQADSIHFREIATSSCSDDGFRVFDYDGIWIVGLDWFVRDYRIFPLVFGRCGHFICSFQTAEAHLILV
jgi:hypothetical protein